MFSPCYWSPFFSSHSFTHIYNSPLLHLKTAFKNTWLILEEAFLSHSQPALASTPHHVTAFWQKGMGNLHSLLYSCYNYLSWCFVLKANSLQELYLCRNGDTENCMQLHTSTQSSLSLECSIFCNSVGRAAMLELCTIWKYFPSNQ